MISRDLFRQILDIPGWRTKRRIIVFESDDWGSIRMPSKEVCEKLKINGIKVDNSDGWFLDTLENRSDLQNFFEVISGFKDKSGNAPIFTFNTVMANPDFEKIKASDYQEYYYEHFFDSYQRYYGEDLRQTWDEGIQNKLIQPQFHAREHLNVALWMKDLRNNHKDTRFAFEHGFFGLVTNTSSKNQKHYLAAYRAENLEELDAIKQITKEGLTLFEDTFGFKSKTFIACNYIWPKELETTLLDQEIQLIQSQRGRVEISPSEDGETKIKRQYTGKKINDRQIFSVRNVKFEPFENADKNWVDQALKEIETSFFWHKPAIVSTHRINYVGTIDPVHRDRNLGMLSQLLKATLEKWPDVEFMSSDQLLDLIKNEN